LKRKQTTVLDKEVDMTSIADGSVHIQATSESNLAPPGWFGEIVLISSYLRKHGVLSKINERVRFARRRFGHDAVIDFLAVLAGLRHQWRANSGRVLRATPALCGPERARYVTVTGSPPARRSPVF
jgi:hypothetical protein